MAIQRFNAVRGYSTGITGTAVIDDLGNITGVGATFSGAVTIPLNTAPALTIGTSSTKNLILSCVDGAGLIEVGGNSATSLAIRQESGGPVYIGGPTNSLIAIFDNDSQMYLQSPYLSLGDGDGVANGTSIVIDDTIATITTSAASFGVNGRLVVNAGISAAGGITFSGNVSMTSTSSHTGLASFAGGLSAAGSTFSGNVNLQDNTLSRIELLDYCERYVDLGDQAATKGAQIPIDLSTGQVFRAKLTLSSSGLNVTNVPDNGNANAVGFTLLLVGDGTARTMTWNIGSTAAAWASNIPPAYTSTLNKTDIYSFLSRDGGSNWFAFVGGQNF